MPSDPQPTNVAPALAPTNSSQPRVSIIVACRDVGSYIDAALWSARRQSLSDIEIIVIDDGSTDDTRQKIDQHAAEDPRLRVLDGPGRGPAAARNIGLKAARGQWIAVLDGDDIMHPRRLDLLLASSVASESDILADNQILFFEDGSASHFLLEGEDWQRPRPIDLALYIRANTMFAKGPALGYLKPLIRAALLGEGRCLYDESLRIGEDYDLIARLMLAKARFNYLPGAYYFYRRHQASISFRLGGAEIATLIAAADRFQQTLPSQEATLLAASRSRRRGLMKAAHFAHCVDRLKARAILAAATDLVLHPGILPLLIDATRGGLTRRLQAKPKAGVSAASPATRRFALLTTGNPATSAPVVTYLEQAGWQGRVYPCPESLRHLATEEVSPLLLELATARNSRLVLYDDPALVDCLPYLLSPAATSALVSQQVSAAISSVQPDNRLEIVLASGQVINPAQLQAALAHIA